MRCLKAHLNQRRSVYIHIFDTASEEFRGHLFKMGKKDKNKKKGKGAEKTSMKTDKKLLAKQKKLLEKIGEVRICRLFEFVSDFRCLLKSLRTFCSVIIGGHCGYRSFSRGE